MPTIRVQVTDTHGVAIQGFRLTSDGVEIPSTQLTQPIIVEAGPHALHFEAPGYHPLDLQASLRPSDREHPVTAVLQTQGESGPVLQTQGESTITPNRALPITLAAVSAVALGTSLYFGLRAHSQYEDLKSSCAPTCSTAQADSVRTKVLISDVTLLGSAVAIGAAAWLYFGATKIHPTAALYVQPHINGATQRLRLAF